jgi:hypothetical protein
MQPESIQPAPALHLATGSSNGLEHALTESPEGESGPRA